MSIVLQTVRLTDKHFRTLSRLVKEVAGINLHEGKRELVKSRLIRRLRQLEMTNFDEYIDYLAADASATELTAMLDAISTNLTSFFRENAHFEFLNHRYLPELAARKASKRLRVWSAGCSSGEEPYTIAICLREHLPQFEQWDAKILASDLSTRVLAKAREGLYAGERLKGVPAVLRRRYFRTAAGAAEKTWRAAESIRSMVTFARVNLMEGWPMRGPFDVIFCRNVMIYFDKPTQARLVGRFWDLLGPGGMLFIGHSESLTGVQHRFRYVEPTVYQKP